LNIEKEVMEKNTTSGSGSCFELPEFLLAIKKKKKKLEIIVQKKITI